MTVISWFPLTFFKIMPRWKILRFYHQKKQWQEYKTKTHCNSSLHFAWLRLSRPCRRKCHSLSQYQIIKAYNAVLRPNHRRGVIIPAELAAAGCSAVSVQCQTADWWLDGQAQGETLCKPRWHSRPGLRSWTRSPATKTYSGMWGKCRRPFARHRGR